MEDPNISLADAQYLTMDLSKYGINAEAGLYLEFDVGSQTYHADTDGLILYLNMPDSEASELQRQLETEMEGVYVAGEGASEFCNGITCTIPGINDPVTEIELKSIRLPWASRVSGFTFFRGGFNFIRINSFPQLLRKASKGKLRLIFPFRRRVKEMVHQIQPDSIHMNYVPVVNLFEKRSDRASLELDHEFHLTASRMASMDYEVYSVQRVNFYDSSNQCCETLQDLYFDAEDLQGDLPGQNYSVHRRERIDGQQKLRSSYMGTEVFLSFSGRTRQKYYNKAIQVSADLFCTNRNLPLLLRPNMQFSMPNGTTVKQAVLVTAPTKPEYPLIMDGSQESWEMVSFLTLQLSSLLWHSSGLSVKVLRELIRTFSRKGSEELKKNLAGIVSLRNEPHLFRFTRKDGIFFEDGWKIELTLNEPDFVGTGYYIFGCMVKRILENYVPINSASLVTLYTVQQGKIAEWMI